MRFTVTTLGCKANQYDTGTIAGILSDRGHLHVKPGEGADICIINTCAVTAESVRKSRQAVRKMKKLEPDALIAVCGCHAKLDGSEVELLGADLVGGTDDREEFANKIIELVAGVSTPGRSRNQTASPPPVPRTRALLKIQDGCDNYCTYCIIPYARGASRSMPLDEIKERARKLQEQGYKEIVVTGIEISSWGKEWQSDSNSVVLRIGTNPTPPHAETTITPPLGIHRHCVDSDKELGGCLIAMRKRRVGSDVEHGNETITLLLSDAIKSISTAAPNTRIRLGSLDPRALSSDLIDDLAKIPNLCNHFHISLQSGNDETLKRMGRRYKTTEVLKTIKKLKEKFPGCAITADLIVGFPGETDEEFEKTIELIKIAGFSDMHIFPYSKRPGTAAETMPGQIENTIKQQRAKDAKIVAKYMKNDYLKTQIGKTLEVLFEEQKGKYSIGHSSNYLKVAVQSTGHGKIDKNTLKNVKIVSTKDGLLLGKIV